MTDGPYFEKSKDAISLQRTDPFLPKFGVMIHPGPLEMVGDMSRVTLNLHSWIICTLKLICLWQVCLRSKFLAYTHTKNYIWAKIMIYGVFKFSMVMCVH